MRAHGRWMRELGLFDPVRLVFVDEATTSINVAGLARRCGRGG
jgi:hypothetical protein